MMIYKTTGMTPLQAANVQSGTNRTNSTRPVQYDRVEVTNYSQEQRFALELSSKISQEVRVGQPDKVSELKQQVQNNEYNYDLDQLTAQIMLFGGIKVNE